MVLDELEYEEDNSQKYETDKLIYDPEQINIVTEEGYIYQYGVMLGQTRNKL